MTRDGKIRARATVVGVEAPIQVIIRGVTGSRDVLYLTKDEAIGLAKGLTDAVDELELAEAVSGS